MIVDILAYALQLLSLLPPLITAGVDVVDMIEKANADLAEMKKNGTDPTDAQWEELNALVEKLRADRPVV